MLSESDEGRLLQLCILRNKAEQRKREMQNAKAQTKRERVVDHGAVSPTTLASALIDFHPATDYSDLYCRHVILCIFKRPQRHSRRRQRCQSRSESACIDR